MVMMRVVPTNRFTESAPRHRSFKCPDCGGIFRQRLVTADEPPPDRCPLCQSWMVIDRPPDPVFVPEAPGIRENAYAQSVDQTYRTMEAASIERAKAAADILEVTEADMSHLKITNMRDPSEMREGDIAAITPPTPPGLLSGGSKPGFQQLGGVIPNYAPGVGAPNAGEAARQTVTANHASRAAQLVGAGQMGSFRE